ncbi:MAG: hypothetical protein K2Q25_07970 [Mycobacteriaceae bacterium]|nr:hypothetical protein [Mycobacteriaceae bacterium]
MSAIKDVTPVGVPLPPGAEVVLDWYEWSPRDGATRFLRNHRERVVAGVGTDAVAKVMTTAVQGRDGGITKPTISISVDPPMGEHDELGDDQLHELARLCIEAVKELRMWGAR